MSRLHRIMVWPIFASLLLTACGGSVTADIPAGEPSSQTETSTQEAEPTEEALATPLPEAALIVYEIVPEESEAAYEVGEIFINQNNRFNLAIGVTHGITGSISLDPSNPQNSTISTITIDISQLRSDSNMRDNRIRNQWLESARYPTVTFEPVSIEGLPSTYTEGEVIAFQVTGDLTVRETTTRVTFDVTASLQQGTLQGQATLATRLTALGVEPPNIAGVLTVDDEILLRLNFVARAQ